MNLYWDQARGQWTEQVVVNEKCQHCGGYKSHGLIQSDNGPVEVTYCRGCDRLDDETPASDH